MVRKRPNLVFLIFLAGFLLLFGQVQAQAPDQPLVITLEQSSLDGDPLTGNPISIAGKDLTTVEIVIEGQTCPSVPRKTPVDVVLLIDTSGSMSGEKIEAVQEAAVNFLSFFDLRLDDPTADQVAIVVFDASGRAISGLNRDIATLEAAIRGLDTGGGTNMADGLRVSADILGGPQVNSVGGAVPVIVMLSDGVPDSNSDALAQAERARTLTGAQIVTIGLGTDIDRDFLRQIADTEADAHFAATPAELGAVYQQVATEIQPRIAGLNLEIRFTYNRALYELQSNSIKPTDGRLEGDTIIWNYDQINAGKKQTFQFDVRSTTFGISEVGNLQVRYIACEAEGLENIITLSGPAIDTLIPTPTPLPTSTATPTVTPLPSVTPTATPIPAEQSNPERIVPDTAGVTADYCTPGGNSLIWDVVRWAVALLLMLFLLLWGWRRGQGEGFFQRLCRLMPALFAIWFVALVVVFLDPFKIQVCELPESVYFWRERDRVSGVYLTHEEFSGEIPPQVEALNDNDCIGCHDVNSASRRIASIVGPLPGAVIITDFNNELIQLLNIKATYVSFSPDGQQLAITDENANIQILDIATGSLVPLAGASDLTRSELMPAWSVDGQIAFVVGEPQNVNSVVAHHQTSLWIVPATGGTPQEVISQAQLAGVNYHPAFSKDGRWLAFVNAPTGSSYANPLADIYFYDRANSTFKKIEDNTLNANDSYPAWNADSTKLAFNTSRDGDANIMVVSVSPDGVTSDARALNAAAEAGIFEYHPVWGEPLDPDNPLNQALAGLLPLFPLWLGLLFLLMLVCVLAQGAEPTSTSETSPSFEPTPVSVREPIFIQGFQQVEVLWKAQPTLVIGLGHAGRHILTHVKKNLLDAGLDEIPEHVRLLSVVSGSQATQNKQDYQFAGVNLSDEELVPWRDSLRDIWAGAEYNEDMALREWVNTRQLSLLDPQHGLEEQRILGRLALINNLRGQTKQSGVNLWERLKALSRLTLDKNDKLNVVLVAALDDAVGSGAFIDLAYMVRLLRDVLRQEGQHVEGVRITAHFITDKVDGQRASLAHRQANVTAALRELKRFQMAGRYPTKIVYRAKETEPNPLTGENRDQHLQSALFDDIFIHDGESQRALYAEAATVGVFPAIADSITLWMDQAAQDADLAEWRGKIMSLTHTQQTEGQSLIVGGLGIYQYRLPFADLLNYMTLQFAAQVLRMLLMGDGTAEPRLERMEVKDSFGGKSPDHLAQEFLSGRLSVDMALDAAWREAFMTLFKAETPLKSKLSGLKRFDDPEQTRLKNWLESMLRAILNGRSDERVTSLVAQRGAKLAYAQSFLQSVATLTLQLKARLENELSDTHPLAQALALLAQYSRTLSVQLEEIGGVLGVTARPNSIFQDFREEASRYDAIWENLQKVKTRRYILQDDDGNSLAKLWYDKYMSSHLETALSQLYWIIEADQIRLAIKLGLNDLRMLDIHDPAAFEHALLELGRHYAQGVRQKESLATVLGKTELNPDNLRATTQRLIENSSANLGVSEGRLTTFMSRNYILSVNENVRLAELENHLANQRISPKVLRTNDPNSLSLVETLYTIPFEAIPSLQNALEQYSRDLQAVGGEAFETAVFEPEATALAYERGMQTRKAEFTRPRRLLHPVIVGALTNRAKAEVYLLGAALSSQLQQDRADMGLANWVLTRQGLAWQSPEWSATLVDLARGGSNVNLLVTGLYAFVERIDETATRTIYNRYRNDDTLHAFWEKWLDAEGGIWGRELSISPDELRVDLIDITRLLILQIFGE